MRTPRRVAPLTVAIAITSLSWVAPAWAQSTARFTTVLGGSGRDLVFDIAVDPAGAIYVTGETWSADFPVVGGVQASLRGSGDAFVAKLGPDGTTLVYATYLGGSGFDSGRSIAVDTAGNAYVTGYTDSADFPLQNPLDANRGGPSDAFIVKLGPQGNTLLFSTYFGGSSTDNADAIALDAQNNVYVAGRTAGGLPLLNAAQSAFGGVEDAFVLKLNASLSTYAYVTYLGGGVTDIARGLDVDELGRACVAGFTQSGDFPAVNAPAHGPGGGAGDGFFALLAPDGGSWLVSSPQGGSALDSALSVACTTSRLAVVGETASSDFPTGTAIGAQVQSALGGDRDGFLSVFDVSALPAVTLSLGTYVGGRRDDRLVDVAVAGGGGVSVFGDTESSGLPQVGGTPTGLTGAGVFVSPDGGATWAPSGLAGIGINGLARAPATPPRLLAATDLGLHVSVDGGTTWARQTVGYPARVVHAVAVSPSAPCTWVIGIDADAADGATPVGAARTIDCGVTWIPWGFPAQRFRQLHWLGDPARLVTTVDRAQPFTQGTQQDTCVVDQDGARVRCFGAGTSDTVIAVDKSDSCRWIEGTAFGAVSQVSGNTFGCDHPFEFTDLDSVGAAVTALAVTTTAATTTTTAGTATAPSAAPVGTSAGAGTRLIYGGLANGKVIYGFPDAGIGFSWQFAPFTIEYPVSAIAPKGDGTAAVSGGPSLWEISGAGTVKELTGRTGAAAFGTIDFAGVTLTAGARAARDLLMQKLGDQSLARLQARILGTTCADEARAAFDSAIARYHASVVSEKCSLANPGQYFGTGFQRENVMVTAAGDTLPPSGDVIVNETSTFPSSGGVGEIRYNIDYYLVKAEVHPEDRAFVDILVAPTINDRRLAFVVEPNTTLLPRTVRIVVTNIDTGAQEIHEATVEAADSATVTAVQPRAISASAAGGTFTVSVSGPSFSITNNDASWTQYTYTKQDPLVVAGTLPAPGTDRPGRLVAGQAVIAGTGPGILTIEVLPNTGPGRVNTIYVGGLGVTVTQAAAESAITDRSFLAEGATSAFFDAEIAVANPSPTSAVVVTATFDTAQAQSFQESRFVFPLARTTFTPKSIPGLEHAEFSTSLAADGPIVSGRLMSWDAGGYGSHAEAGIGSAQTVWYLAEGATHSGFDLFYLLQNSNATDAAVEVRFLRPAPLAPVVRQYVVPARSRFNIWVNQGGPELSNTDVSAVITSANGVPIVVERAMYLSNQGRTFNAGHGSAGLVTPATEWFLAEGATGRYFDEFILVANSTDSPAEVAVQYLLEDGSTVTKTHTVSPNSRFTIWVDLEDSRLADAAVSARLTSTNGIPILVERAMWWPGGAPTWHEAHNSAGSRQTGTRWAVATGEAGGANNAETYVLVANTSALDGEARVTLLFEDGATPLSQTIAVLATSRTNVPVTRFFPAAAGRRFGVLVESLGTTPAQLVVEAAIYSDYGGVSWAAGANLLATPVSGGVR
jgi:hypothetical protein